MKLREKICEPFGGLSNNTANELEKISDEYAMAFADWCKENSTGLINKETLQIFKKEKGL